MELNSYPSTQTHPFRKDNPRSIQQPRRPNSDGGGTVDVVAKARRTGVCPYSGPDRKASFVLRKNLVRPTDAAEGRLGYADDNLLDIGDIIEAMGPCQNGTGRDFEIGEYVTPDDQSDRPLPDQWSGLQDREQVFRKRYLDTTLEPESFQRFGAIANIVASIRIFLRERGFIESTTPILQPQYGGGTAKPFKTHVNALGCEMYLAISHELYLKRLSWPVMTRSLPSAAISEMKASIEAITRNSRWWKPWLRTKTTNTT